MGPNGISRTVNESGLSSTTLDIIQPDLSNTVGEASEQSNSTYKMSAGRGGGGGGGGALYNEDLNSRVRKRLTPRVQKYIRYLPFFSAGNFNQQKISVLLK